MRHYRHWVRNALGQLAGVQGDLQIWWTPEIPVIYVSNPKSGCSTIKDSLKAAQAEAYHRSNFHFQRADDAHIGDDCLKNDGLSPRACRQRYVISCVRNPFTRALSGFLDKVNHPDAPLWREFGYRRFDDFETYLRALAKLEPRDTNSHFRAQHINLDCPRIVYDAIFFLENLPPLARYLSQICPDFKLKTRAPHARGANAKLRQHYTGQTIELVREIFARDFELFGYSDSLDETDAAPGKMIAAGELVPDGAEEAQDLPPPWRSAAPGTAFERALRYRRLIDMRLI